MTFEQYMQVHADTRRCTQIHAGSHRYTWAACMGGMYGARRGGMRHVCHVLMAMICC
ncbi:uncharacterized protein C8R40DRAFT_1103205, partial [Lentinula edodes]|uniref:uncharacterized protein n=1 Tax=Lentinula edodes TaxID=5353 RepID=UPI001E8D2B01